ncbi:MAG: protein kinase [Planctomycetota bacterium]
MDGHPKGQVGADDFEEEPTEFLAASPREHRPEDELGTAAITVPSRGGRGRPSVDTTPTPHTEAAAGGDPGATRRPSGGDDLDLIMAARMQSMHRSGPMVRGAPGGTIPGYQIQRELHRGGQGVVYLATHEGTRRQVAIKVMLNGGFASPHDKVRFEREIQVLAQLNNPNIVTIHDSGQAGEHAFYVMDFVSGPTLDEYVESRELALRDKLEIFVVVCHAVNAAHLRGVIHRDLKPSNIRVTPEGSPQVLDFGLAKVAGEGDIGATMPTQMTRTGQFIGSLPWASPEQARGDSSKIDVRTDVYALGVILYQLLCTGRFPYDVDAPIRDVLDNIIARDPDRPRSVDKRVEADAEAIVLKALEKLRERRYQSAGELARDIERYLAGEAIEARRWNKRYLVFKFIQRNRAAAIAVALGFAAVVAGAVLITTAITTAGHRDRDNAMTVKGLEQSNTSLIESNAALREENEELEQALADERAVTEGLSAEVSTLSERVQELEVERRQRLDAELESLGEDG